MDEAEQQRRLWDRRIRHALFWARVQTGMMLVIATASIIVAIGTILAWLS